MTPRKIAGVLLGFGGVATMIGPSLLVEPRQLGAGAARLRHRLVQLRAGGRVGAPLPRAGHLADEHYHRPADRRRPDHAADVDDR